MLSRVTPLSGFLPSGYGKKAELPSSNRVLVPFLPMAYGEGSITGIIVFLRASPLDEEPVHAPLENPRRNMY